MLLGSAGGQVCSYLRCSGACEGMKLVMTSLQRAAFITGIGSLTDINEDTWSELLDPMKRPVYTGASSQEPFLKKVTDLNLV